MDVGDRDLQILLGIPTFLVGLGLLLLPFFVLEAAPDKYLIAGGLVCAMLGLWLAVPYGIGGLMEEAADTYSEATGDDDE